MKSLETFREELLDFCVQIGWRHWTKLGVPGRKRADEWINADPEALVLLIGFLGNRDLRLLYNVIGWLLTNQHLVHKSRLKTVIDLDYGETVVNLGKIFRQANKAAGNAYWDSLKEYCLRLQGLEKEHGSVEGSSSPVDLGTSDYKTVKADRENNRIVLRVLFGTTVRAELFNFFFGGGSGNSRSIAQYTQLSQSTVHTILNELVKIELIEKRGRSRSTSYEMVQGRFSLEGLRPEVYFDWANYFRSIIRAWDHLETLSEPDSEYKTRSALRQFYKVFSDNLSDWNARFVASSDLESARVQDFMEKEAPEKYVLEFIKRLATQVPE